MARSTYIYIVRHEESGGFLGAFTVKREANTWAREHCRWPLEQLILLRCPDGCEFDQKHGSQLTVIPWDSI